MVVFLTSLRKNKEVSMAGAELSELRMRRMRSKRWLGPDCVGQHQSWRFILREMKDTVGFEAEK